MKRLPLNEDLVADTFGALLEELEVGLVVLKDMVVGDPRVVHLCRQSGIAGDLTRDVGVFHLQIRFRPLLLHQSMATVEAANGEERGLGVVKFRFQAADLPVEQFGDLIAVAHVNDDDLPFTEQVVVDPFHFHFDAVPTFEADREHPSQLHVFEDPDIDQVSAKSLGDFAAVDLDPEVRRQCVEACALGHGSVAT